MSKINMNGKKTSVPEKKLMSPTPKTKSPHNSHNEIDFRTAQMDRFKKRIVPYSISSRSPNYYYYMKCLMKVEQWNKKAMVQYVVDLRMKLLFEIECCTLLGMNINQIFHYNVQQLSTIEKKARDKFPTYLTEKITIQDYCFVAALETMKIIDNIHKAAGTDSKKLFDYFAVYAATNPKMENFTKPISFNKFKKYCQEACKTSDIGNNFQKNVLIANFINDVTNPGFNKPVLDFLIIRTGLTPSSIIAFYNTSLKRLKLMLFDRKFYHPEESAFEQFDEVWEKKFERVPFWKTFDFKSNDFQEIFRKNTFK